MNYEFFSPEIGNAWCCTILGLSWVHFHRFFFTAVHRCRAAGQRSEERWSATQGQRPEEYGRWHQWVKIKINYSKFIPNLDQPLFTYISYIFTRGESVPTIHCLNGIKNLKMLRRSCRTWAAASHQGGTPDSPLQCHGWFRRWNQVKINVNFIEYTNIFWLNVYLYIHLQCTYSMYIYKYM